MVVQGLFEIFPNKVAQTGRLVVVEEGQGFVSLGAEIISQAAERFANRVIRTGRVAAAASSPLADRTSAMAGPPPGSCPTPDGRVRGPVPDIEPADRRQLPHNC